MRQPEPILKPVSNGNFLFASTLVLAFAAAAAVGNFEVNKMQDADPVFVMNAARQQIQGMGYTNVQFSTFNKAAAKPAHVTFSADQKTPEGILHYKGMGDCSAISCSKVSIALDKQNPFTPAS
jgi:hypothetical protein